MQDKLIEIHILFKELNQVYSDYSKYCNLPDAAVWILYALRNSGKDFTQKALSELWFFKKQTVTRLLGF